MDYDTLADYFSNKGYSTITVYTTTFPPYPQGKIVPGGYILIDDSNRERYKQAYSLLKNWTKISFYGPAPAKMTLQSSEAWQKPIFH